MVKAYLALASHPNAAMCAKQALKRSPQSALAWSLMGTSTPRIETTRRRHQGDEQAPHDPRHVRSVKALAALNIKIGKVHVARAILQRQLDDYQPSDENELVQLHCRYGADVVSADGGRRQVLHARVAIQPACDIAKRALEKFEQTRNPEHAATMSDEDQEGAEDMMEEERGRDWMVEEGRRARIVVIQEFITTTTILKEDARLSKDARLFLVLVKAQDVLRRILEQIKVPSLNLRHVSRKSLREPTCWFL